MALSVTGTEKQRRRRPDRSLASVTAIRRAVYSVEGDRPDSGVFCGSGREWADGEIRPDEVLHDLFKLRFYWWDWQRRVRARREIEWNRQTFGESHPFERALAVELADPEACAEAGSRWTIKLRHFLKAHGPLVESDCVSDFVGAMETLAEWAMLSSDTAPNYNPETETGKGFLADRAARVAKVNIALKSIEHQPGGKKLCPSLFAALAWAIDQSVLYGLRYRRCANGWDCITIFVPLRSDAKYCSARCKQRAHRRKRA
jgi:hypothetical protein